MSVLGLICVLLALVGRLTADATSTYFEHLAAAAFVWIAVTAAWGARLMPAWASRGVPLE